MDNTEVRVRALYNHGAPNIQSDIDDNSLGGKKQFDRVTCNKHAAVFGPSASSVVKHCTSKSQRAEDVSSRLSIAETSLIARLLICLTRYRLFLHH